MRTCLILPLLLGCLQPSAFAQQAQTPFPGTIPARTINTQSLLTKMNAGSGANGFLPVAAHRGYWRDVPENSLQSIAAAYNGGIEAVEIDVRVASTNSNPYSGTTGNLTDPNAQLVLSHDECVDRISTGHGALRATTSAASRCSSVTGLTGVGFTALELRDRHGAPIASTCPAGSTYVTCGPATLLQTLNLLAQYSSVDSTGIQRGPVLILDMKDKDQTSGDYTAWNDYLYALHSVLAQSTLPPANWSAVLFKMKMATHLPSATALINEVSTHPTYGHVVLTVNPEDALNVATNEDSDNEETEDGEVIQAGYGWNGASFYTLEALNGIPSPTGPHFNVNYVEQFELVPNNAIDNAGLYLSPAISPHATNSANQYPLISWATYYQPSFYPEGVANRFGTCCQLAPLVPTDPGGTNATTGAITTDQRGILDFSTYYDDGAVSRTGTITSDNLFETLNYLIAIGVRTTSQIQ